jgi:hypothetical protein
MSALKSSSAAVSVTRGSVTESKEQPRRLLADFLTDDELAEELGIRPSTLDRWYRERRKDHRLPPETWIGRYRYHHADDIRAWLRAGGLSGLKMKAAPSG